MALDPWTYSKGEAGSEHAHQVALFMWANMAEKFGISIANDHYFYTKEGHLQLQWQDKPNQIPELRWLHAIHNQGHGDVIRGAKAAAEGVRAGVLDLFLPVPREAPKNLYLGIYHGLYIEMKRPALRKQGVGAMTDEQSKFADYCAANGYAWALCFSWEEARDALLRYLGRSAT